MLKKLAVVLASLLASGCVTTDLVKPETPRQQIAYADAGLAASYDGIAACTLAAKCSKDTAIRRAAEADAVRASVDLYRTAVISQSAPRSTAGTISDVSSVLVWALNTQMRMLEVDGMIRMARAQGVDLSNDQLQSLYQLREVARDAAFVAIGKM